MKQKALLKKIKHHPNSSHFLNLKDYDLSKIGAFNLAQAFALIPPWVMTLDLTGTNIWQNLEQVLQSIPGTVRYLNLSWNHLNRISPSDLAQAFQAIPSTVFSLRLAGNYFHRMTASKLAEALQGIPPTVRALDLSWNRFHSKTPSELAQALQGLPATVTSLRLSWGDIHIKPGSDLPQSLQMIPPTITSLYLTWVNIYSIPASDFAQAMQGIPPTVNSLYFDGKDLYHMDPAYLAEVFQAIPPTVTSLCFINGNLHQLSNEKLTAFVKTIPAHIQNIDLGNNKLFLNQSYKNIDQTLLALGENRERFILTGNGESDRVRFFTALTRKPGPEKYEPSLIDLLPADVLAKILSYLPDEQGEYRSRRACKRMLDKNPMPKILTLIQNTENAIGQYLKLSEQRGSSGLFKHHSHQKRTKEANKLLEKIKITPTLDAKIKIIDALLKKEKPPFKQHSVAHLLLKELSDMEEFNTADTPRL